MRLPVALDTNVLVRLLGNWLPGVNYIGGLFRSTDTVGDLRQR
jgi:hypothetical protein